MALILTTKNLISYNEEPDLLQRKNRTIENDSKSPVLRKFSQNGTFLCILWTKGIVLCSKSIAFDIRKRRFYTPKAMLLPPNLYAFARKCLFFSNFMAK